MKTLSALALLPFLTAAAAASAAEPAQQEPIATSNLRGAEADISQRRLDGFVASSVSSNGNDAVSYIRMGNEEPEYERTVALNNVDGLYHSVKKGSEPLFQAPRTFFGRPQWYPPSPDIIYDRETIAARGQYDPRWTVLEHKDNSHLSLI